MQDISSCLCCHIADTDQDYYDNPAYLRSYVEPIQGLLSQTTLHYEKT